MADILPQNFPMPQESAITSYPYQDIAEGTGIVKYTLARIQTDSSSANDRYLLTAQSGLVSAEVVAGQPRTQLTNPMEFNFDIDYNTPKIVSGDIYAIISYEITGSATTTKLRILKWDGSTETELAAQVTYQATSSTSGNYVVPVLIAVPTTKFKIGESLRLELVTSGGTNAYLQHDPTASISSTKSGGATLFYVPYKISV